MKKLFIKEWIDGNGDVLTVTNPATGEITWEGKTATAEDVDRAFKTADAAWQEWALTPVIKRIEIVEKYRDLVKENKEVLTNAIMSDTGKPQWEAATEAGALAGKVDISVKAYHERTGTQTTGEPSNQAMLTHRPLGVCAVFGPYNFPGHLPNGHIVPALIAGNTIVFKPSEQTPSVAEIMINLFREAGVPDGVLNLVVGELDTAKAIVAHPLLHGFFFTGSSSTGAIIHKGFAGQPGKVLALEMGGNNPLIICEDVIDDEAARKAAVYNTIQSAFITAGQRCTCARRLLVPTGEAGDVFLNDLIAATKKLKIDKPDAEEAPFFSTVINEHTAQLLLDAQAKLVGMGATALLEMKRLDDARPYVSPAIIDVTDIDAPDEEYFGPLLQVKRVADLETAIRVANDTQYGLSAGIYTNDDAKWETFYSLIRAGIVNRNKPLTGASSAAPFGGLGASGNHRPGAYYAADYCAYAMASVTSDELTLPATFTPGVEV